MLVYHLISQSAIVLDKNCLRFLCRQSCLQYSRGQFTIRVWLRCYCFLDLKNHFCNTLLPTCRCIHFTLNVLYNVGNFYNLAISGQFSEENANVFQVLCVFSPNAQYDQIKTVNVRFSSSLFIPY